MPKYNGYSTLDLAISLDKKSNKLFNKSFRVWKGGYR